jgi:hypothetical protein
MGGWSDEGKKRAGRVILPPVLEGRLVQSRGRPDARVPASTKSWRTRSRPARLLRLGRQPLSDLVPGFDARTTVRLSFLSRLPYCFFGPLPTDPTSAGSQPVGGRLARAREKCAGGARVPPPRPSLRGRTTRSTDECSTGVGEKGTSAGRLARRAIHRGRRSSRGPASPRIQAAWRCRHRSWSLQVVKGESVQGRRSKSGHEKAGRGEVGRELYGEAWRELKAGVVARESTTSP